MKEVSYYKETIPTLIENYKLAVQQCLEIIKQPIDDKISDDKLHAVLKSKRMASEDAKFYAKEVDSLLDDMNGVSVSEEETTTTNTVKKYSRL